MATQPSILRMLQARMRSSVKQYNQALDILNTLADSDDESAYDNALSRERLLRGVVRGCAQMFICVANPAQANSKDAINDLEIDYGIRGKRSRPKAQVSETVAKFMEEYYDE